MYSPGYKSSIVYILWAILGFSRITNLLLTLQIARVHVYTGLQTVQCTLIQDT